MPPQRIEKRCRHAPRPNGLAQAVAEVAAAAGPERAQQVAQALSATEGRFVPIVGTTGDIYTLNARTGIVSRTPYNSGAKAGSLSNEEARIAASQIVDAIDRQETLLRQTATADVLPLAASVSRGLERVPVIGGAAAGLMDPVAQAAMSPEQQQFQQLGDVIVHNYGALLPRGQRSRYLLENFRSSFIPKAGASPQARQNARRTLRDLRAKLVPLMQGQTIDLRRLPFWNDAAKDAAATPATPAPTGPIDYQSYLHPPTP